MTSCYLCPVCQSPLMLHQASKGFYCENKHHFDINEHGYHIFSLAKKPKVDARKTMRAKRFLLESGIFSPLIETLTQVIARSLLTIQPELKTKMALSTDAQTCNLQHLEFDCGEGYFMRQIKSQLHLMHPEISLIQTGIDEAENAIFAAAKAETGPTYIVSNAKKLPLADASFDLITLIDKPLKGKELVRALAANGVLIHVSPGPRHLWQIREFIYKDLTEKPINISYPNELTTQHSEQLKFNISVTGEQALALVDMSTYGWRANDQIRHEIAHAKIEALEVDFVINVMTSK